MLSSVFSWKKVPKGNGHDLAHLVCRTIPGVHLKMIVYYQFVSFASSASFASVAIFAQAQRRHRLVGSKGERARRSVRERLHCRTMGHALIL